MATESSRGLSDHVRGVTVTTIACLAGVAAAVVGAMVIGTDSEAVTGTLPLAIVAVAILAQQPILYALGVDISEFGAKDNLYVAFMTFALWFLSSTIVLSTGVSF